jgi:hypothetical protein
MQSVFDDLRRETGIELKLDYQGSVDATNALDPGDYHHDLAWLTSDRYFQRAAPQRRRSPAVLGGHRRRCGRPG